MEIPEKKKVKIVAIKFKATVVVWWEQTQEARVRAHKDLVKSWRRLKKLMKKRFLPKNFQWVLFIQYQNYKQGQRTVDDYTLEFHNLASRNELNETKEQLIARYVGGLKFSVQEKIPLHTIVIFYDAINMARKIEQTSTKSSRFGSTSIRANNQKTSLGEEATKVTQTCVCLCHLGNFIQIIRWLAM